MVKNLSALQETWVLFLGREDPLVKEMASHCSILPWKILWTEESGGLKSMGSKRVRHDLQQLYSLNIRRSESFNITFQGCLGLSGRMFRVLLLKVLFPLLCFHSIMDL